MTFCCSIFFCNYICRASSTLAGFAGFTTTVGMFCIVAVGFDEAGVPVCGFGGSVELALNRLENQPVSAFPLETLSSSAERLDSGD